ncbi:MAG: endolytic transglycosylase MltG [Patescibacteria group bacterium]
MRKILFLLGLLCLSAAVFLAFFVPAAWLSKPSSEAPTIRFEIKSGETAKDIAAHLKTDGVILWQTGYRIYGFIDATVGRPKAGVFNLKSGMSYRSLARMFALGPQKEEIEAKVIEGWTLEDEARSLEKMGSAPAAFFALTGNPKNDKPFNRELAQDYSFLSGLPKSATLEGYLFPNTYRVWRDQLPEALIRKQLDEFGKQTAAMRDAAQKQGKNFRDVLILASIVEKEATDASDKKIVAGILSNRLRIGMALQTDSTINYVIQAGRARATLKDLELVSPYNTYKNKGLPPAPICNPGHDALDAALNPAKTDYLYYLHDADGKSYYAKTLEEHKRNRFKAYGE